ncbi:similar to mitochondrial export translocase Oxa1 [Plenodomus lingam JN3]|uniref:Similar to mitochondrial export translocase Oxa1 n=1 Tax=Leptosphaeria maculans (strain JN3 / isolate v23.1.3 / race Av1-4-5-6-7-8) TaxID=985895 RepID=E5AEB9_LEPMJ|nr:similar to mitochondrial export translocase Oxa1 [Plenodomus lingam JN3]CBY01558.1 similar to mitochondrial export translocase Oxa1 [Plenodomus lingam JN3]
MASDDMEHAMHARPSRDDQPSPCCLVEGCGPPNSLFPWRPRDSQSHFAPMHPDSTIQYSSLHRTAALSTTPNPLYRRSPLQSASWRTGAIPSSHKVFTASSVRYGSWYAPWSWGKSSAPASEATSTAAAASSGSSTELVPIAEYSNRPASEFAAQHASSQTQSAVTTSTPEIAPAAIDQAAVVDSTSNMTADTDPVDSLLLPDLPDLPPTAVIDPTKLIDHVGQLKELGLDYGWGVTTVFERMIEYMYLTTGLGWGASIVLACVAVRSLTFYFQVRNSDKMAVMASMKPITQPLQEKLEAAIARGDDQQANIVRMQQSQVLKPYVGSMASMGGFMVAQAWIGFCAFRCLRAMGQLPVPGMNQDGFLWFADLTMRDPYFILPATTSAIMYFVFKKGGETGITQSPNGAVTSKIMSGLAVFVGLITAFQPAGLQIYFLVSGIFGAVTGWLLRQNWFRHKIGIHLIPDAQQTERNTQIVSREMAEAKKPVAKLRYQAPTLSTSSIKIKPGTPVPAYMRREPVRSPADGPPSRDYDFEEGAAGKPLKEKLDYYRRNYRLSYVARRMAQGFEKTMRSYGLGGKKVDVAEERRKKKAQEWEIERRRRFENRK